MFNTTFLITQMHFLLYYHGQSWKPSPGYDIASLSPILPSNKSLPVKKGLYL